MSQGVLHDFVQLHGVLLKALQDYTISRDKSSGAIDEVKDGENLADGNQIVVGGGPGERQDSNTVEEAVAVEEIDSEHEFEGEDGRDAS